MCICMREIGSQQAEKIARSGSVRFESEEEETNEAKRVSSLGGVCSEFDRNE